ncbi:MAG: hypothetical protein HC808_07075 [Candidatus Competibacteraceae bacterium]|nr:hypothetical protein [Candidatus Competibacteraceae bacterium]
MTNARALINSFTSDLENIQDKYTRYVINPYTRAYIEARQQFDAAIKAQAESDKLMLEIALTALSIAGGALLTKVFAAAALKEVAADVAVDIICKHNLERAFKVAALVDASPTASYILGQLWDTGQGVLSNQLKQSLTAKATTFPSLKKFSRNPLAVRTYLQDFVLDSKIKAHDTAAEIRDNPKLSDQQKIVAVKKLRSSQFCSPPSASVDEANLSKNIELTWWMTHVLDLDYRREYKWAARGGYREWGHSRKAIETPPSSPHYPKGQITQHDEWKTTERSQ